MRAAAQSLIKINFSLLCAVSAQTRPHQHLRTRASAHPDRKMVRHYPKPLQHDATEKQTSSIIIIHGLGDSGEGWASFGPELSQDLPYAKFIFPTAPQMPVTLNGGMIMNSWYDIYSIDKIDAKQDAEGLKESASYILGLVQKEVDSGIDAKRVVVAGFSQGGALALLSLRQAVGLAGVLSMSGYLTMANETLLSEANKATPLLMCHGTADPVVAYHFGEMSQQKLKEAGANLTFKSYPGLGHSLAPQEIVDVKAFLKSCLPKV